MRRLPILALPLIVALCSGPAAVTAQEGPKRESESVAKPRKKAGEQPAPPEGEKIPSKFGKKKEPGAPEGTPSFKSDVTTVSIDVAVLDNKGGRFTPGLSARVRLTSGEPAPAVLVPDRAIGTDQTRKIVLTVGANNVVAPREVQLGALDGGMRVVQGLKAGELVIVDGLQRAFPGAPVTPTVLKVDAQGMPIVPPPAAPGAAPAGEKK